MIYLKFKNRLDKHWRISLQLPGSQIAFQRKVEDLTTRPPPMVRKKIGEPKKVTSITISGLGSYDFSSSYYCV